MQGYEKRKEEKDKEHEQSCSLKQRETSDRMKQVNQQILGKIKIIAGGGTSNNVRKRHLRAMMNAENKKWKEHYEPIYFTKEDFGGY